MMLKLRYGGSGNVKTKVLERAQKTILQCRTAGMPLSMDSNMVMAMITEILDKRTTASEFCLDSGTSLDMEDSKFDESVAEELPVVRHKPVKKKPKVPTKVKASSKKYLMNDGGNRRVVIISLLIAVVFTLLGFLSYYA